MTPREFAAAIERGTVAPVYLVIGGARLKSAARRILDAWRERAFVFNLGHGVVPETPADHVAALAALIRGDDG